MPDYPYRPPRRSVDRPAVVTLDGGDWLSCMIRNVSRRGACISMVNTDVWTDRFDLEDKFTRERWQAEVRWRGHNRLGLRIFGPPPSMAHAGRVGFGKRR